MKVYTYSEARQKLAKLLNEAREEGAGVAGALFSFKLEVSS